MSCVTIQVYLHDIPPAYGGATTFLDSQSVLFPERGARLPCQPRAGSVLVFTQNLYHEGSQLKRGLKYTFRTEAMYDASPHNEDVKKTENEKPNSTPDPSPSSSAASAPAPAPASSSATAPAPAPASTSTSSTSASAPAS